ncbi:MAG: T9SS type B sorting domain-containing protein [Cyclobacteriaceae bacterium]|nr:T9SS type B sorting domain-containing protein [Cyclobacteriaceae bacterium]
MSEGVSVDLYRLKVVNIRPSHNGAKHRWPVDKWTVVGLLFCCLISTVAIAQPYPSRLGRFQVDQKKGCAPFTITLTNLLAGDCTPGKPCVMDYEGNNTQQQNQFSYTYTKAGTYTLKVIYQSIGQDDIVITVVENTQPNFEIYACSGNKASIRVVDNKYEQYVIDFNNDGIAESTLPFSNNILTPPYTYTVPPTTYTTAVRGRNLNSADNCSAKTQQFQPIPTLPTPRINLLTAVDAATIKLDFTTAVNIQYRLEIAINNSANFQLFQTLYGINTLTVPNLRLDDNYYCFRLSAFDPCNNQNNYSAIICSQKLTVTAQSDVNQVVWATGGGAATYTINRNKSPYRTQSNINLSDTDIVCKTDYCYQVVSNFAGGARSISLEKCVQSFSTKIPTAVENISAVSTANTADLTWQQDPRFIPINYSVFRASNSNNFGFFTTAPEAKLTDNTYNLEGKFCYQMEYTDKCGNSSPKGSIACPLRLTGNLDKNNSITLSWNKYTGWKSGVKNYVVEKFNLQGSLIKTFIVTDTVLVDDQPDDANQYVRYSIKAQPNQGGVALSISNPVEFIKNANLYHPSAFTPNGDNLNDTFTVNGQFIAKISLKIFDRWGALLFASDKNEAWDGQFSGKQMPAAVYIWKADISDLAGRTFSEEGTVSLIRN